MASGFLGREWPRLNCVIGQGTTGRQRIGQESPAWCTETGRTARTIRQGADQGHPAPTPPRRKAGTATGFSVVDVGGNWLRFYRHGSSEDEPAERRSGLLRVLDVAARQGDPRADEAQAIAVLDAGLGRHPEAPPIEVFEALLYRAEPMARTGADSAPDLAAARALIAKHELGAEAERALTLEVEAELTTDQQKKKSELGEGGRVSNENDSPSE